MADFELRGNGLEKIIADLDEKRHEVAELESEIREARGLVRMFPPYLPGVKALVVIVSNWGGNVEETVNGYVSLLRATYEEGYWEGDEGSNVTVVGCGRKRVFPASDTTIGGITVKGKPVTTSDLTGSHELKQKEFEQLIVDEDLKYQEYDQIHIIGHGDTETGTGLMFFWKKDEEGKTLRHPFLKEEATRINKRFEWPIKGGGVVILMGCETIGGGLLSFLNGVLSDCVVFGLPQIANCNEWEDEKTGETVAMDWYYREQFSAIQAIAGILGIPKPGET